MNLSVNTVVSHLRVMGTNTGCIARTGVMFLIATILLSKVDAEKCVEYRISASNACDNIYIDQSRKHL